MNKNFRFLACLTAISVFFSACTPDEEEEFCEHFHWSYHGEYGPDTWAECETGCGGNMQSPVDLTNAVVDPNLTAPDGSYGTTDIELIHNGHAIELKYDTGSVMMYQGVSYYLRQVHFHTGSEHQQDGTQYLMEVHLVHSNAANTHKVVIGVFIDQGAANPFLASLIGHLPAAKGDTVTSAESVHIQDVFPSSAAGFYTYEGSLTTPPCTETVTWIVLDTPATATDAQISAFNSLVPNNYRPLQALNGRVIKKVIL
jgi:carbonic anhydrase